MDSRNNNDSKHQLWQGHYTNLNYKTAVLLNRAIIDVHLISYPMVVGWLSVGCGFTGVRQSVHGPSSWQGLAH